MLFSVISILNFLKAGDKKNRIKSLDFFAVSFKLGIRMEMKRK